MNSQRPINVWFDTRGEKSRNWLALGLLLSAWNFADNDAVRTSAAKPVPLHRHAFVTVRAARSHDL